MEDQDDVAVLLLNALKGEALLGGVALAASAAKPEDASVPEPKTGPVAPDPKTGPVVSWKVATVGVGVEGPPTAAPSKLLGCPKTGWVGEVKGGVGAENGAAAETVDDKKPLV